MPDQNTPAAKQLLQLFGIAIPVARKQEIGLGENNLKAYVDESFGQVLPVVHQLAPHFLQVARVPDGRFRTTRASRSRGYPVSRSKQLDFPVFMTSIRHPLHIDICNLTGLSPF
jgi:hypothetical protein